MDPVSFLHSVGEKSVDLLLRFHCALVAVNNSVLFYHVEGQSPLHPVSLFLPPNPLVQFVLCQGNTNLERLSSV